MEVSSVSVVLFASRAWDALTDPLVGYLVSRSRWTPVGRLSPWWVCEASHFLFPPQAVVY